MMVQELGATAARGNTVAPASAKYLVLLDDVVAECLQPARTGSLPG